MLTTHLARQHQQRGDVARAQAAFRSAALLEREAATILRRAGASAELAIVAEAGARAALSAHDLSLARDLAKLGLSGSPSDDLRWRLGLAELEANLRRLLDEQAPWFAEFPEEGETDLILRSTRRRLEISMVETMPATQPQTKDPMTLRLQLSPDCELTPMAMLLEPWLGSSTNELFGTWDSDERFLARAA